MDVQREFKYNKVREQLSQMHSQAAASEEEIRLDVPTDAAEDKSIWSELKDHRDKLQPKIEQKGTMADYGLLPAERQKYMVEALIEKVEALNGEVFLVEHALSRERIRRKEVEARLERTEEQSKKLCEEMDKFHEAYGTNISVWLASQPKFVRRVYYPVRVLFALSAAMAMFNLPIALLSTVFSWTGAAKVLWFAAIVGIVGYFVFGALSRWFTPDWIKERLKEKSKPVKKSEEKPSIEERVAKL
jgi:hypothetical protein